MVGSPDYTCNTSGQFNGTLAPRSSGSALKPFTYALALEKGFTAASILPDIPLTFRSAYGNYIPKNYSGKTSGPVLFAEALGNSLNVPAVYLLDQIGGPAILQNKLKELGITTLHRSPRDYGLGLTLGTGEVTLLELANAYATLARLGQWKLITYLQNQTPQAPNRQVFDPTAALLIAAILSDPENRLLTFGRSPSLQFPFPVACKTGTSTNYRDNWCLGYTPEFTVGVWAGNFDGTPMRNVTGLTGAAPIFHEIFTYLHQYHKLTWYDTSQQLVVSPIDALTGGQPSAHTQRTRTLFFSKDPPPVPSLNYHPESGHLLLPPIYKAWLSSLKKTKNNMALVAEATTLPQILNPIAGTTYILDPDLPPSSRTLRLEVSLPDSHGTHFYASSPTLAKGKDSLTFQLKPGTHDIYLHTLQKRLHTWIEVHEE